MLVLRGSHIDHTVPPVVARPSVVEALPVLQAAHRVHEEQERIPSIQERVEGKAERVHLFKEDARGVSLQALRDHRGRVRVVHVRPDVQLFVIVSEEDLGVLRARGTVVRLRLYEVRDRSECGPVRFIEEAVNLDPRDALRGDFRPREGLELGRDGLS